MKKCKVCKTAEATMPDRDDWPRHRIRICEGCHAKRLSGDIIVAVFGASPKKKS